MDIEQLKFAGYGLALGLCVTLWVAYRAWLEQRKLDAEVRRLREHLNIHLEITHDGSVAREQKLDQLRLENENLRIAVHTWRQKPERRDLRLLQVYSEALHELLETTPGFSVHWQGALRKAEQRVGDADRGLLAIARRWFAPAPPRTLPETLDVPGETKPEAEHKDD